MSMSVPGEGGDDKAMSDINTTPLVDVMLVLLIIFLITIPVITQTIPVELPKVANQPTKTKPENITVAVNADGEVFWNQAKVPNDQALLDLVKSVAVQDPQPEIHIRGDSQAKFAAIGRTIYLIQRGGVIKVGFITEPDRGFR
ncbi:MAG: biopolymer transporter ExbD [Gammaproteobacteria bacterium]|nr:biopolymer transporter ExbD [Gammaproteobacteria bacterium]